VTERATSGRVVPVHNLRDYFRESIGTAIDNQGVNVDDHAAHYPAQKSCMRIRAIVTA